MNRRMKEKVILTDVDGVLLDWEYTFSNWLQTKGNYQEITAHHTDYGIHNKYGGDKAEFKKLVREFNNSAWIGFLPAFRDAVGSVEAIRKEFGYTFHVITSLSEDEYACHLRTMNLERLFGKDTFTRYIYLDTGADKDEALKDYAGTGCIWVEDKPENAQEGLKHGLCSVLMQHKHTSNASTDGINIVDDWRGVYHIANMFYDDARMKEKY